VLAIVLPILAIATFILMGGGFVWIFRSVRRRLTRSKSAAAPVQPVADPPVPDPTLRQ
jgi:hypothetical protein